jgi:hypothetical protein
MTRAVPGGHFSHDLAGAVGRVVVHNQDLDVQRQAEHLGDERLYVRPFIVRRHYDE